MIESSSIAPSGTKTFLRDGRSVLVVAPFLHRKGHYHTFPIDLARGFAKNGWKATILHPIQTLVDCASAEPEFDVICISEVLAQGGVAERLINPHFTNDELALCAYYLSFRQAPGSCDLVYWTDFETGSQRKFWSLILARWLGCYRHPTGFSKHYKLPWSEERLHRLLQTQNLLYGRWRMFVHSRTLLTWTQKVLGAPQLGEYVPWGLWPAPASGDEKMVARQAMGLPIDARVLLVFGIQSIQRKHIDTLARVISRTELVRPLVVIFAGLRIENGAHPFDVPELNKKPNLKVRHYDAFIPEQSVKQFFAAADAVWAYYGGFIGASGVLFQAMSFGRMSICSRSGEIGEISEKYEIGLNASTGDERSIQSCIETFMSMTPEEQLAAEENVRNVAAEFAWNRVAQKIVDSMSA